MVEHKLPKLGVAGSSPVSRSIREMARRHFLPRNVGWMTRLCRLGPFEVWAWSWGLGIYGPYEGNIAKRIF